MQRLHHGLEIPTLLSPSGIFEPREDSLIVIRYYLGYVKILTKFVK
jgi:hypothetical protein